MRCNSWRLCFFVVICLLRSTVPAVADDAKTPAGLRVFYTGHSFHMFVAPRIEQLVKSADIQGHKLVGTQGIGGSRVIQHWDLPDSVRAWEVGARGWGRTEYGERRTEENNKSRRAQHDSFR